MSNKQAIYDIIKNNVNNTMLETSLNKYDENINNKYLLILIDRIRIQYESQRSAYEHAILLYLLNNDIDTLSQCVDCDNIFSFFIHMLTIVNALMCKFNEFKNEGNCDKCRLIQKLVSKINTDILDDESFKISLFDHEEYNKCIEENKICEESTPDVEITIDNKEITIDNKEITIDNKEINIDNKEINIVTEININNNSDNNYIQDSSIYTIGLPVLLGAVSVVTYLCIKNTHNK